MNLITMNIIQTLVLILTFWIAKALTEGSLLTLPRTACCADVLIACLVQFPL